jgi:hypothetical protein
VIEERAVDTRKIVNMWLFGVKGKVGVTKLVVGR